MAEFITAIRTSAGDKKYDYNALGNLPELPSGASTTNDGTIVSQNADFAEVAEWGDGNPDNEDRTGYFVCADVPVDGIVMKKATSVDDVKGVTILAPAFAGNYTEDKVDSEGNLLPKYSYVAIIGFVPVIDNGTCTVGGRCMPDDNGCAIPSSNSMGYQVVNRIDENRVLIIIEPNGDMVQRIKTRVVQIQEDLDDIETAQDRIVKMIDDAKVWIDNGDGVYVGSGEMPAGAVIQIDPTGEAITVKDWIRTEGHALLDMVYPVGSIYMSVNVADPSALFGGTWERLRDRFLLGAGDSYAAGATGGEASHTLTVDEMPSHNHQINPIIKTTTGGQTTTNGWMVIHSTDNLVPPDQEVTTSTVYGGYSANAGGSRSHNNMPPYLSVYMWKRIA